jgi:asparagine synthase (glutamine-hydrolysing)
MQHPRRLRHSLKPERELLRPQARGDHALTVYRALDQLLMCGICGIAYADQRRPVAKSRIEAMCDSLSHRGPDDSGVHLDGNVGLGHRRLSIVDLAGGHQPMANEDESIWISYNGEVYNHADFRSALTARGHRYRSRCDTEAIIHLYEELGSGVATALRGMFAFAIWDRTSDTLLLVRDRLGVKPLFYAVTAEGDLVFGSEIKSLFVSGLIDAELDEAALPEYFATGHTAGPGTLYRGVRKLEPGHVLVWRNGTATIRPYWRLRDQPYPGGSRGRRPAREEAAEQFWFHFRESVRRMLMADVPLGVFLSGGLDSSLIVAAMRECGVEQLRSFSVGTDNYERNELPSARMVASRFGTDHHEIVVDPEEFFAAIPDLTWHRDLPLTFSASVPLYFVSRLARDEVKVVLTGEGGDELLGGYGRYRRGLQNLKLARALDALLPARVREGLAAAACRAGDSRLGSRIKRSFIARRGTLEDAYLEVFAEFDRRSRKQLLAAANGGDSYAHVRELLDGDLLRANPLEAVLRLDQLTYLEELLAKQDQMSMAASIESRVPFLDETLVEWAARLDSGAKVHRGVGKWVERVAATGRLPDPIVRGEKRGFSLPMARWLRGPGKPWLEDAVPTARDDLLRADYVRQLIREHQAGRGHTAKLWRILAFQVWRRDVLPRARQTGRAGVRASA